MPAHALGVSRLYATHFKEQTAGVWVKDDNVCHQQDVCLERTSFPHSPRKPGHMIDYWGLSITHALAHISSKKRARCRLTFIHEAHRCSKPAVREPEIESVVVCWSAIDGKTQEFHIFITKHQMCEGKLDSCTQCSFIIEITFFKKHSRNNDDLRRRQTLHKGREAFNFIDRLCAVRSRYVCYIAFTHALQLKIYRQAHNEIIKFFLI